MRLSTVFVGGGMSPAIKLLNSITDADASALGAILVSGSHGGLYPAAIASQAGARAVIFNDAGIGLDGAGVAGIEALAGQGMAAAAADCMSCRIGDAEDAMAHGVVSHVNSVAAKLGIAQGMTVARAAEMLVTSAEPKGRLAPLREARWDEVTEGFAPPILFVDSASLVTPRDEGRIIVTGSHGGLVGGDPRRALKARARLAVFNDAGFGKDRTGISRLPALDRLGVAALTVSHDTARIGDAKSCIETGVISALNASAAELGFEINQSLFERLCLNKLIHGTSDAT